MLTTLDKVYSNPALPPEWLALKDRAYAAAYLKAAARAYHQGAFAEARRDLAECVRLDPAMLDNEGRKLADQLLGWATAPMAQDGLGYLESVYANLPDEAAVLRQRRRRDLAQLGVQLAFEAYKTGNLRQARSALLRALRYQPGWLANRGVLSILARSWRYS
jgi:tetratricopeptide (TPR) repeat protein